MEIREWLELKQLDYKFVSEKEFLILGVDEKFLVVSPKNTGTRDKILNSDLGLLLTEEELAFQGYYAFEFGGIWYYSNQPLISKFEELSNLGVLSQKEPPYIPLGIHGRFEIMNGVGGYEDFVRRAKFLGQTALGLAERHTLGGSLNFQLSCESEGIKPIIGEEFLFTEDELPIKLFVQDEQGWVNILALNRIVNTYSNGVAEQGYLKLEDILAHKQGLVLVLGEIPPILMLNKLISAFSGKCFFQFSSTEWDSDSKDIEELTKLKKYIDSFHHSIPAILLNDTYFPNPEDVSIRKKIKDIESGGFFNSSKTQYLQSSDEIFEMLSPLFEEKRTFFKGFWKEMVENTHKVANLCNFKIVLGNRYLPKFDVASCEFIPEGFKGTTASELLKFLVQSKIDEEDIETQKIFNERVAKELRVIEMGGFEDYFLIFWDRVLWCQKNNILTGPGRGSAAGSLVSYLLGIVKVNPLKYGLLFERFLNEGRIKGGLPDIDLDIEGKRKYLLLESVEQKYGKEQVCYAGAYKTLKIKQAIKDLGRGKIDYGYLNKVTEIEINESRTGDWREIFALAQKEPFFKRFVIENPDLINSVKKILNQPRSKSIHPSAQIIIPKGKTVFEHIPVRVEDGKVIAEFDGSELEKLGYLKNDWLSLAQLDKIKEMLDLIEENYPEIGRLDIYSLPVLQDEQTFELFQNGITEDVFQFGSKGLKQMCLKTKPDNLGELADIVSLFRPGPIGAGAHHKYIKLKHGEEIPEFDFGCEEITKSTKGLYIYQEQVMQIVQKLGGFSLAEADEVRRAMGKKKAELLHNYKEQFLANCVKIGATQEQADGIWQKLEYFSGYGFNKSHAISYSYLGVISQYIKAKYPMAFWVAALQNVKEEFKLADFLAEIDSYNLQINFKGVDINGSEEGFSGDFKTNTIFWSLSRVDQIGEKTLESFQRLRGERAGRFFSFEEFLARIVPEKSVVNKAVVQNLILSGAFDEIGSEEVHIFSPKDRGVLLKRYYEKVGRKFNPPPVNEDWWWGLKQKATCGFSEIDYGKIFKTNKEAIATFDPSFKFYSNRILIRKESGRVLVGGVVQNTQEREDKNGNLWGLVSLTSNNTQITLYIWNSLWEKCRDEVITSYGKILLFQGFLKNPDQDSIKVFSQDRREEGKVLILDTYKDHALDLGIASKRYALGEVKDFKDGRYSVVEIKDDGSPKWRKVR